MIQNLKIVLLPMVGMFFSGCAIIRPGEGCSQLGTLDTIIHIGGVLIIHLREGCQSSDANRRLKSS